MRRPRTPLNHNRHTFMPLYLFHGDDSYTSVQKALHWQKEFQKKYGDMNVETFDGQNLTAAQFAESISTLPFLSEKKLVLIRDFFQNASTEELKKAAEYLQKNESGSDDSCVVVFVERKKADARTALYKNIKKYGEVKEYPLLEKEELVQWIATEVQKQNKGNVETTTEKNPGKPSSASAIQLTSQNMIFLAESVGPNLWQMKQELEKIELYSVTKPNNHKPAALTNEQIAGLISPNPHTTIWRLTDQLALKNRKESLKTLGTLLDSGENIIQMLFMIVRHFRILILIQDCLKQNIPASSIAKKIKQHPFTVQNGIKQVKNFTPKTLAQIYEALLEIDIATKGGKIRMTTSDTTELRLALEQFIMKLCT
jgi:DNA polymerase III subunit delta